MKHLFKTLGFLEEVECGDTTALLVQWPNVLLVATFGSTLALQNWPSFAALSVAALISCYRAYLTPKPVPRSTKTDLDQLAEEVRLLKANLTATKLKLGLEGPRFSMFNQGKT